MIRIDVHPAGENPINTIHMLLTPFHIRSTYVSYEQSTYVATFHESSTELDRVTAPEKKGFRHNPQHAGWPIRRSIPSFSPESTNEVVEKATHLSTEATRLTGPISPACDRYVQYLLMGANRTVLNRHRRRLQPWRCRLATYPLLDLPNQLSPLPPSGPAQSPF
jgi:hypothetical protein